MDELNVVRVEGSHLVVQDAEGNEYTVPVDDVTVTRLKRPAPSSANVVSPREIQAHLRAGLSRDEVSALTGAPLADVERFEGPILAELEYVLNSALSLVIADSGGTTVATRVATHIERAGGTNASWRAWRTEGGEWNVKCAFLVSGREHEARWSFEPRHGLITPLNDEAASLLDERAFTTGVIPRLRAVDHTAGAASPTPAVESETAPVTRGNDRDTVEVIVADESVSVSLFEEDPPGESDLPADDDAEQLAEGAPSPTADLLAALRKRRGENQEAPSWLAEAASEGAKTHGPSITDELAEMQESAPAKKSRTGGARRQRATMPTWDEIVFGTKVEDDLL